MSTQQFKTKAEEAQDLFAKTLLHLDNKYGKKTIQGEIEMKVMKKVMKKPKQAANLEKQIVKKEEGGLFEYEIVRAGPASYPTNEKPGTDFGLDGEDWEVDFEMAEAEMEGFVMVDDAIGEDFLLVDGSVTG